MKGFLWELDEWTRYRIRALAWHRYKRPRTKYKKLVKYAMKPEEALNYANTRKGAWAAGNFYSIKFILNNKLIHQSLEFVSWTEAFQYKKKLLQ